MWTPRAVVAVLLSVAVLTFFTGTGLLRYFDPTFVPHEKGMDLIQVLLGGLLVWLSEKREG